MDLLNLDSLFFGLSHVSPAAALESLPDLIFTFRQVKDVRVFADRGETVMFERCRLKILALKKAQEVDPRPPLEIYHRRKGSIEVHPVKDEAQIRRILDRERRGGHPQGPQLFHNERQEADQLSPLIEAQPQERPPLVPPQRLEPGGGMKYGPGPMG